MSYRSLYWEDVEEGQALPPINYELSLLRLIAFVRATGLYDYVHFDRDYAQAAGARDVFASTPHMAGLFSRLLTDWSGPEADIRSLSFSMKTQSCSYDILSITGRVGKKYQNDQGEYVVDVVDLNVAHELAPNAAVATATMAFPSRTAGAVQASGAIAQKTRPAPNPGMPDFAKPLMGKPKSAQRKVRPLTPDEIHLWCECLEDWNPLYWDTEYANKSRHGGLISPPVGNFFGMGSSANVGIGYLKPGETVPDPVRRGLTGLPLLKALREDLLAANIPLTLTDFPEVVVADSHAEYHKPVRPGDSVRLTQELVDCSAKKRTKLGEGYFFTWLESAHNQRDELVKTLTYKLFYYRTC